MAARSSGEYRSSSGPVRTRSAVHTALGPALLRFVYPDGAEGTPRQMRSQPIPKRNREIFRGRNPVAQPGDVGIEVAMIDLLDDLAGHQIGQLFQVHHVSSRRIDLTRNDDFDHIVVTMQVHALPVQSTVFIIRTSRIAQLMRGVEALPTADTQIGSRHDVMTILSIRRGGGQ